jgi:hypothetical protein
MQRAGRFHGPGPKFHELTVRGFKSHRLGTTIALRALTILAGANSSGKSSLVQPLMLLKQTVDATADPGPLKLDGPNVHFTEPSQFLSYCPGHGRGDGFEVGVKFAGDRTVRLAFAPQDHGIVLARATYGEGAQSLTMTEGQALTREDFESAALDEMDFVGGPLPVAMRSLCFLVPGLPPNLPYPLDALPSLLGFIYLLRRTIHLPGHRGNPARMYTKTATGPFQPGLFHEYAASIVSFWAERRDRRLDGLGDAMRRLGLGWKVTARPRDAVNVEARISRTPEPVQGGARDLVSIADVGFGVSQTLPVLVALVAAEPGQLVYVEQPEIHLHPRAQKGLADLMAETVARGVQLIVETHSDIVLTRLQWNVATRRIPANDVVAHWATRDADGMTRIDSRQPDRTGAFGEWPVDFADVAAEVDRDYVEAAQQQLRLPPG